MKKKLNSSGILVLLIQFLSFIAVASPGEYKAVDVYTQSSHSQRVSYVDYGNYDLLNECRNRFGEGELYEKEITSWQKEYYYFFALPSIDELTHKINSLESQSQKVIFQAAIDTLNALNDLTEYKSKVTFEVNELDLPLELRQEAVLEKIKSFVTEMKYCNDESLVRMLHSLMLRKKINMLL